MAQRDALLLLAPSISQACNNQALLYAFCSSTGVVTALVALL